MRRPRIKAVHSPFALPPNKIVVGLMQCGVAAEIFDDDEQNIERLLTLMDGTRDLDTLCQDFVAGRSGWEIGSVRAVVDELASNGFVEDAAAELPAQLTAEEALRYESNRHFLGWIDVMPRSSPYEVQGLLKNARISLLGLGGTGSAVAAALVASGIGSLRCADFDSVDLSNLPRQLLYDEGDVGAPKVDRACHRLRAMNRHVEVIGEQMRVAHSGDIERLMTGCDAFVLCADEPPEIVSWTNTAALRLGIPWFVCFYTGPVCVVGSFIPGETGCWECLEQVRQSEIANRRPLMDGRRPNAVIAANANIGGQLCALEIAYHIGGLRAQTRGRIFHFDCADWTHVYQIDVPWNADCYACGTR